MNSNNYIQKKIILIGDAKSGKTSLVNKLIKNQYTDKYIPTLGVEVHPYKYKNYQLNL